MNVPRGVVSVMLPSVFIYIACIMKRVKAIRGCMDVRFTEGTNQRLKDITVHKTPQNRSIIDNIRHFVLMINKTLPGNNFFVTSAQNNFEVNDALLQGANF